MTQSTAVTSDAPTEQSAGLCAQGLAISAETYHWRIPSKPELVEKVVMQLKDRAEACGICTTERSTGLVISLTEAITNAMVHGNLEISSEVRERTDGEYGRLLAARCSDHHYADRQVQIDVHWNGSSCEWVISDVGSGFDVDRLLRRLEADEPNEELASGRGILLMKAFMDEVQWSRGGREVRLTMGRHGPAEVKPEDRKQIRQAVKAKGFDAAPDDSVHLVATSISSTGIELLGKGVEHAKRLLIEVDLEGARTLVPAEVRQVTKLAEDWVQIDCRFGSIPADTNHPDATQQREAIEQVLRTSQRAADDGDERRENDRFEYTGVIRIQRQNGTIVHAIARDLSRGGLAFIGNFELLRNEPLTLTLEPETATPITVRCEVMRCQQLAGIYRDFGVRFLDS